MAATITGPVRLPDGTVPAHGRIIFRRVGVEIGGVLTVPGPVSAPIEAGGFSIALDVDPAGAVYTVAVEYQDGVSYGLTTVTLPDIVLTANAEVTLENVVTVPVPRTGETMTIRQGESLNVGAQYLDHNNRPVGIGDVSITSWLGRGEDRVDLNVSKLDASAGTFEVSASASVTSGLLGRYDWAIRMASGGRVIIETTIITVERVA